MALPDKTNSTLTLIGVEASDSGGYSVTVWNSVGSVVSTTAHLAVLADGANGNQPTRVVDPIAPAVGSGQDSIVIVTHGWQPAWRTPDTHWVANLRDAIRSRVSANWAVTNLDWVADAYQALPDLALIRGAIVGSRYGRQLGQGSWQHVHFIGHSAGARLIESAAKAIKDISPSTVVHCTFLDPDISMVLLGIDNNYGANANWADCYFTQDGTGGFTAGGADNGYNVDVSWVDPKRNPVPYGNGQVAFSSHEWPHDFYFATITNIDSSWCTANFGYPLSKEAGGWENRTSYPVGNTANPLVLCGPVGAIQNPTLLRVEARLVLDSLGHAISAGATLFNSWFTLVKNPIQLAGSKGNAADLSQSDPVWLALAVPITNGANFVQFNLEFTDTNSGEGLLTVFWNTNQIGMVDQRVTFPGLRTYRFALPGAITNGLYTLSFRLDVFSNLVSSVTVTNVTTGFGGSEQPVQLDIVQNTNSTPSIKLTGAAGFSYLLQTSTNLVDWAPSAVLANTNGTVWFTDSTATNSLQRFYRAVLP